MLTQQQLLEEVRYVQSTGIFYMRGSSTRAGSQRKDGYRFLRVLGKTYLEHRLAYLYVHGHFPKEVDHDDGNPSNNKIHNLFDRSHRSNIKKCRKHKNNTSGFKGVDFRKDIKGTKKWRAQHRGLDGKQKFLGLFSSAEEASLIYIQAAEEVMRGYDGDLE